MCTLSLYIFIFIFIIIIILRGGGWICFRFFFKIVILYCNSVTNKYYHQTGWHKNRNWILESKIWRVDYLSYHNINAYLEGCLAPHKNINNSNHLHTTTNIAIYVYCVIQINNKQTNKTYNHRLYEKLHIEEYVFSQDHISVYAISIIIV